MDKFFSKYLLASDYRKKAQEQCKKYENKLIVIYLVYFVAVVFLSLTGIEVFLSLVISGALAISFAEISKRIHKNEDINVESLMYGFNDIGKTIILHLLQTIFTFLWSLLFVIPGIIKGISYSMSYYIANDNKDLSASECIDRSKQMMDGYKWEYFCLMLSYIGWILLSVLTFGILFIWVLPRIEQASYLFYLKISGIGKEMVDTSDDI